MNTIAIPSSAPRPRSSWLQSACAAALGVFIGFVLGMTTLSSAPPGSGTSLATQSSFAPTPAAAASGSADPLQGLAQAQGSASWTDPAPAASEGLEPCWASVREPVRC